MISVTSKSRYAVVAMAELARSGERPVPIAQIAERRAMPVQFLEQLFSTLRRDGLLRASAASRAATRLPARPRRSPCSRSSRRSTARSAQEAKEAGGIWEEGVEALRDVFSSTTIADIARREADEAGAGMYHI